MMIMIMMMSIMRAIYFGYQGAAIAAIANTLKEVINELNWD